MLNCFICNKYIYLYIYICLFHFVINEEKLILRYNGGEKEWGFSLNLDDEGGLEFYNRLQKNKKIEVNFTVDYFAVNFQYNNDTFPSLVKTESLELIDIKAGDILANKKHFLIYTQVSYGNVIYSNNHKIGHIDEFSRPGLNPILNFGEYLNLEFVLEEIEKPDATKIAEINKKIIIIMFIGLSILIILFILFI